MLLALTGVALLSGFREFPADTKVGDLRQVDLPLITISATVYRAAPGLRVFDQRNFLVLPPQMPNTGRVAYQIEATGLLRTIWFLLPEEDRSLTSRP